MPAGSQAQILPVSSDALIQRTKYAGESGLANPAALGGLIYIQGQARDAIASSTDETNLIDTTKGAIAVYPTGVGQAYPFNNVTLQANVANIGTTISGKFFGTIGNTGTPTARLRLVLVDPTGTVKVLSDTTALTMSTITAGQFVIDFDVVFGAVGSAGSAAVRSNFAYTANTNLGLLNLFAAPAIVTSIDTTKAQTLQLLFTWGASSASNTITVVGGRIGLTA